MTDPLDPIDPLEHEDSDGNDGMEGRYTNYFQIGHNALEFLVDFGQKYSGNREYMHSRMVMSPAHAKELFKLLGRSIDIYEEQFGEIEEIREKTSVKL
jgi:hypothetical protein